MFALMVNPYDHRRMPRVHNSIQFLPFQTKKKPIVVRSVWAANLDFELALIQTVLSRFFFVSMDTEFPGLIYKSKLNHSLIPAIENYQFMRSNVNDLKLIQLGLTLSDSQGNLPDFGTGSCFVWEFNFSDFDITAHAHDPESVALLEKHGTDFARNKKEGIDSKSFAQKLNLSGLIGKGNYYPSSAVTWITFHGAYDFGFIIKILTQKPLPEKMETFNDLMRLYFGVRVYDMKYMITFCNGLYGGLESVASNLRVDREAGQKHQAGSDSLLTMKTFMKLMDWYFNSNMNSSAMVKFQGRLFGLAIDDQRRKMNC